VHRFERKIPKQSRTVRAPFPSVGESDEGMFALGWYRDAGAARILGGTPKPWRHKGRRRPAVANSQKTKPHAWEARGKVFLKSCDGSVIETCCGIAAALSARPG